MANSRHQIVRSLLAIGNWILVIRGAPAIREALLTPEDSERLFRFAFGGVAKW
jgi:hypothetical protein